MEGFIRKKLSGVKCRCGGRMIMTADGSGSFAYKCSCGNFRRTSAKLLLC